MENHSAQWSIRHGCPKISADCVPCVGSANKQTTRNTNTGTYLNVTLNYYLNTQMCGLHWDPFNIQTKDAKGNIKNGTRTHHDWSSYGCFKIWCIPDDDFNSQIVSQTISSPGALYMRQWKWIYKRFQDTGQWPWDKIQAYNGNKTHKQVVSSKEYMAPFDMLWTNGFYTILHLILVTHGGNIYHFSWALRLLTHSTLNATPTQWFLACISRIGNLSANKTNNKSIETIREKT